MSVYALCAYTIQRHLEGCILGNLACDVLFRMPSARLYFLSANCAIHAFR